MKRLGFYLHFLKPYLGLLAVALLCGVLFGVSSGFGIPFFLGKVFSAFFEGEAMVYGLTPFGATLLLPLIFLVRGISGYVNQYLLHYCGQKVLQGIRYDLFAKLQELPLRYYEHAASGDLLSRVVGDTQMLQQTILALANDLIRQPIQMLAGISFLIYLSVTHQHAVFLAFFLLAIPLIALPVQMIGRQLKRRGREAQESLSTVIQQMKENLNAAVEIRSFNLQESEKRNFSGRLGMYFRLQMKQVKYLMMTQPFMELLAAAIVSISFYYAWRNEVPASVFLAMGAALYFCFDPLKRILRLHNEVQRTIGALDRIEQVLNQPNDVPEPADPITPPRVRGEIVFENASFRYDESPLFDALAATIPAGCFCALVGPSGGGKSTFAKLIPRFYDVAEGAIRLDGHDIRAFRLHDLREQVAYVPQKPVLFNDTVANNIRLGRVDVGDAEVEEAARNAYAHDFIVQMPEGYHTQVGEDAVRLSGGQHQRLALARAFLKNAPVLILDEATSALDSESEAKIKEALRRYAENRTVIVIAHRLSTVSLADQILVFDAGRIVAHGTHADLLESNALYRSLCARQGIT